MSNDLPRKTVWRRETKQEARRLFFITFAIAGLVGALWDVLFDKSIDFKDIFHKAVYFSVALPICYLLFKLTPEQQ